MAARDRVRVDERLVRDGLADSRAQAQRLVMAGSVWIGSERCDKPSRVVADDVQVRVDAPPRFVSRGGDKLDNALEDLAGDLATHGLVVGGARAIDVGASTGGFTDCLLQRGAEAVVAVDVGYGQLHDRLRGDPRVVVMERTNARHLQPGDLPWPPDLLVCDVSFISLQTVLPAPLACMRPGFWGVLLCKPQFEIGREGMRRSGGRGVVRDESLRAEVVERTIGQVRELGLEVLASVEARPAGPKGNREQALLIRDISSEMPS